MSITRSDADQLITAFNNAKASGDFATFENHLQELKAYAEDQIISSIVWTADDLVSIRPEWSESKVKRISDRVGRRLADRSVEEGWQILEDLLLAHDDDEQEQSAA